AADRSPVKMQAGIATPGMKTAAQAKAKTTGASRAGSQMLLRRPC
ncbi:CCDC57 isoform 20, partial [Pan troglodytes]